MFRSENYKLRARILKTDEAISSEDTIRRFMRAERVRRRVALPPPKLTKKEAERVRSEPKNLALPVLRRSELIKKRVAGKSKIATLQSPYFGFKKPKKFFFKRNRQRNKKSFLFITPARLKSSNKSHKLILPAIILAIAGSVYLVFFSHFFDLKSITVYENGVRITDENDIADALASFRYRNILFVDEKEVENKVKTAYPEIKKLKIKKVLQGQLRLEIEKFPIAANILNVIGDFQKKYLINSNGFLTAENTESSDLPYIKIATEEAFPLRMVIMPQTRLEYAIKAVNTFEEKLGMKILHAIYMPMEREIHLMTEKKFAVWIDMEKDLETQLEKLKRALVKLDIYKTPLQYIDLRISGTDNEKVIYKRK